MNLVVILSVLNPPKTPFCYINTRSVFSIQERFQQSMNTIKSVRQYIPNCFIVFSECSEIEKSMMDEIASQVDLFINSKDIPVVRSLVDSPYKGLGEITQLIYTFNSVEQQIGFTAFSNIFKISGRYSLNENFDFNKRYDNGKSIMKRINSTSIYTVLYKIARGDFQYFFQALQKIKTLLCTGNSIEAVFLRAFPEENLIDVDILGVEGYVSVDGAFWSK